MFRGRGSGLAEVGAGAESESGCQQAQLLYRKTRNTYQRSLYLLLVRPLKATTSLSFHLSLFAGVQVRCRKIATMDQITETFDVIIVGAGKNVSPKSPNSAQLTS